MCATPRGAAAPAREMGSPSFWVLPAARVLEEVGSSEAGLTSAEAGRRLKRTDEQGMAGHDGNLGQAARPEEGPDAPLHGAAGADHVVHDDRRASPDVAHDAAHAYLRLIRILWTIATGSSSRLA